MEGQCKLDADSRKDTPQSNAGKGIRNASFGSFKEFKVIKSLQSQENGSQTLIQPAQNTESPYFNSRGLGEGENQTSDQKSATQCGQPLPACSCKKILVVDDNKYNILALSMIIA